MIDPAETLDVKLSGRNYTRKRTPHREIGLSGGDGGAAGGEEDGAAAKGLDAQEDEAEALAAEASASTSFRSCSCKTRTRSSVCRSFLQRQAMYTPSPP